MNISKEIFEAAGVPVPPGYVKVGAGDLRRVFKEIAPGGSRLASGGHPRNVANPTTKIP